MEPVIKRLEHLPPNKKKKDFNFVVVRDKRKCKDAGGQFLTDR